MYLILFIKRERKRKNNMMKNMNLSTNQTVHFVMKCLKLIQKLSRRAILSGLTRPGIIAFTYSRSSFIFIPLNLDLVAVSIPPVSFSLSKANKHSWGKRQIARIRIKIPPISIGCTFSQVHGRSS